MNAISLLGYIIPNKQIRGGSLTLANAMICDTLSADEATFDIHYDGAVDYESRLFASGGEALCAFNGEALYAFESQGVTLDFSSIPYGTPLIYYHDDKVIGKFYVKNIMQTDTNDYRISAYSAVGLLVTLEHNGGVYSAGSGHTISTIINEIMSGLSISYTIDPSVASQPVSGWLPTSNKRDNLQQLLFAFGISLLKDSNGDLLFKFNDPDLPKENIAINRLFLKRSKPLSTPVTSVTVYEHAYYADLSVATNVVFDNSQEASSVTNQKIIFSNPVIVSTLQTTGTISIDSSHLNPNYAVITGRGTITGKYYSHTIKALTQNTGVISSKPNELIFKNATLVNSINSENCLNRIAYYYTQADEVNYGLCVDDEQTGDFVAYPDPFTLQSKTGLIKQMNMTLGGILKSETKLTENWHPKYLGNLYNHCVILDDSGSWSVPDEVTDITVVLIGGGAGGSGGNNGANGESASGYEPSEGVAQVTLVVDSGNGGSGGDAGNRGLGGYIYRIRLSVSPHDTFSYTVGGGGDGGAIGSPGSNGNHSIFGAYSSADGSRNPAGYYEPITDNLFAYDGIDGIRGGDGGNGGMVSYTPGSATPGEDGETAGAQSGGQGSVGTPYWNISSPYVIWTTNFGGSGGGGASANSAGADGSPECRVEVAGSPEDSWMYYGTDGGDGASAQTPIAPTIYGVGGNGGHGGGGGGGAGSLYNYLWVPAGNLGGYQQYTASGGAGGSGSAGSSGANGCIIIYF